MSLPFNDQEKVTVAVPSGHEFAVVYPIDIEEVRVATGRIVQDLREELDFQGTLWADDNGMVAFAMGPYVFSSIPLGHAMTLLHTSFSDDEESQLVLDRILKNRLGTIVLVPQVKAAEAGLRHDR